MRVLPKLCKKMMLVVLAALAMNVMVAAADTTGTITADALRVRSQASTDSEVLGLLNQGTQVTLTGEEGDWYTINYNGSTAYIHKDYVKTAQAAESATKTGTVTADALIIRADASTESDILGLLYEGTEVELTGEEGDWYTIDFDGGCAYLHKDYIETEDAMSAAVTQASNSMKADVVNLACEYLGAPYVYGGASPSGFDCSGFTLYIYKQFGYSLPHTATGQLSYGTAVSKSELQMGDLVFFRDPSVTSKAASHVGIYIGGGQFVHASSSRTGYVVVSGLDESYWSTYYTTARRLIAG